MDHFTMPTKVDTRTLEVGVLGGRLLAPDHTIVHGGIEFMMTQKQKFGYSHGLFYLNILIISQASF